MYRFIIAIFIFIAMFSSIQAQANTSSVSRAEIQQYLKRPGNAIISTDWTKTYHYKAVQWEGRVFKISRFGNNQPVEVLIKVLPASYLYDTVLIIPANHPAINHLQEGNMISFKGIVTGAVDTALLKEVHVTLQGEDIQVKPIKQAALY